MQAVILCAGKGVRMGELTDNLPKPLIKINGKTLLEYKLDVLPDEISEIVLVIGFQGNKIRETYGSTYRGRNITYVEDKTVTGTAHALWQAKSFLRERFLVMMGDDIYSREAMQKCLGYDFSLACIKTDRDTTGSRVVLDEDGRLIDFVTHKQYLKIRDDGGLIFTGLYSLNTDIFNYEPVKLETKEEWGLPQTVLGLAKDYDIAIIETDFWIPITQPDDIKTAETKLDKSLQYL